MKDDHLPVMGVRYVRPGDVVAEVGAIKPDGVVDLGYVRGLARIPSVKLSVESRFPSSPFLPGSPQPRSRMNLSESARE